jgi:hypothetical protein
LENENEEVVGLPHRIEVFYFYKGLKSPNLANKE